MSEKDKLFHFLEGLKPWAQQELQRRSIADLASAQAAVECLMDYLLSDHQRRKPTPNTFKNHKLSKGKAVINEKKRDFKMKDREIVRAPKLGYFLCGGPHMVKNCPQKQALNALQATVQKSPTNLNDNSNDEEEQVEGPRMGALRLLNAIKGQVREQSKPSKQQQQQKSHQQQSKPHHQQQLKPQQTHQQSNRRTSELMYVQVELNGHVTRAMVDTGATHNFVADREAIHLGLKLERDSSRMKTVNSEARPIAGLARDVPIRVGTWSGKANFMAVPLDDFQVIFGMDFLQATRVVSMSFLDALCMIGDESPCVVPIA
uniref:Protein DDI1 homolog n=1 Tax=Elaeis guineensis var. tenera TaxID=51953 RepID=A0A6I9S4G8_ELAGV|nr:protein DDI1 homolog [Elaeis guineensis]